MNGDSIILASRVADTGRLHAWLDTAFASGAGSAALEHAVRLCLEEAVMNVIMHGYGEGQPGEIEVRLAREPGALLATVSDSAPPFDPTLAPLPPKPPSLLEGSPGGRGLRFMRQFSTELSYARDGGHNVLRMRFAD
jgi:anti-sigma regulatory factor (Ser/Thr protein kinase)